MTAIQALLSEFDQEVKTTRTVLARVPDDKFDWKPHAKSMSLGRLASHIAELTGWGVEMLQKNALDMNPPGGEPFKPTIHASRDALLKAFDAHAAATRKALEQAPDAQLGETWTLLNAGQTVFSMPKGAVLRAFVFNHVVHHRGQLSVYLRLNDVAVPSIYGPSADESGM